MMQYHQQEAQAYAFQSPSAVQRAPESIKPPATIPTQASIQTLQPATQPREIGLEIQDIKAKGDLNHRNILNIIGLYDSEALFSKQYYSLLLAGGTSSVTPDQKVKSPTNQNTGNVEKINIATDIARMASFLHSPSNPNRAQHSLIKEVQEAQKAGRFAKEAGTTWLKHIFGNDPKAFKLDEYIPPELRLNEKAENEPADVFAFACMLKNLMKGESMSPEITELITKCSAKLPADRPTMENCLDTLLLELAPLPKDIRAPVSEIGVPSAPLNSLPSGVPLSMPAVPHKSYKKKIDIEALGLVGGTASSPSSQQPSKEHQLREEKQREIEKLRNQHREMQSKNLEKRMEVQAVAQIEQEKREREQREREEQKRREEEERRRKEEEERQRREEQRRREEEERRWKEEEERQRREEQRRMEEANRLQQEQERARIQREQWAREQQRRAEEWRQQRETHLKNNRNRMCPANIHSVGQFCSIVNGIWRG